VTWFFLIHLEQRDSVLPGAELQRIEQHPVVAGIGSLSLRLGPRAEMACTLDYAAKSPRPPDGCPRARSSRPDVHLSHRKRGITRVMDRSNTAIPAASARGRTSLISLGRPAIPSRRALAQR
jgi:hypothetical protein